MPGNFFVRYRDGFFRNALPDFRPPLKIPNCSLIAGNLLRPFSLTFCEKTWQVSAQYYKSIIFILFHRPWEVWKSYNQYWRAIWPILEVLNPIFCIFMQALSRNSRSLRRGARLGIFIVVSVLTNGCGFECGHLAFVFVYKVSPVNDLAFARYFLSGKSIKKVEIQKWFPRYSRGRTGEWSWSATPRGVL